MRTLLWLLVVILLLPRPTSAANLRVERARHLMGTTLVLTLEGGDVAQLQDAADAAFQEVERLEGVLSNWRPSSELSRLNASAGQAAQPVSRELSEVLSASQSWSRRTQGAFDAVVEPLITIYDLRGDGRWPDEAELARAVDASGAERLWLGGEPTAARLEPGAGVELGGIGKGYALDRAATTLRAAGVRAALLDFGGQLLAIGAPEDGAGWPVLLAGPEDRETGALQLLLRDASLATSSQSVRALAAGGRALGHILDPRSGHPVADWGTVSVVATLAADADAASTALFVMGPESGRRWLAENPGIAAIFQGHVPSEQLLLAGSHPGLLALTPVPDVNQTGSQASAGDEVPSNRELARRIDLLAEELEDREQGEVSTAPDAHIGLAPGASRVYAVRRGASLAGYGEVVFTHHASEDESGAPVAVPDRADFLRLVTYFGYKFSDDILFNSEVEFEHASTEEGGAVSVEFGYLDFLFRAEVNARAGLVLLPVGWLNELHEPPVYLGVQRPVTERVILPSTWRGNGAGLFGDLGKGFSYRAYLVEGLRAVRDTVAGFSGYSAKSGIRGGRQSGAESLVENWAGSARLDWNHTSGLALGASLVTGGSAQGYTSGGDDFTARTTTWDAHAEFRGHGAWLRALYAETQVSEAGLLNQASGLAGANSVGSEMFGWYATLGYDVWRVLRPGSESSLYAFLQFEEVDTQREVPAGYARSAENARQFVTLGASYYPHGQVALKADYQWRSNGAKSEVDRFLLAATYLF